MGHTITNTSIIGILLVLLILQVRTLQVEQSVSVRWSHGRSGHSTEAKPRLHDKDEVDGGIPAEEQFEKITSSASSRPRQKRQMDKYILPWENRTLYYYYDDGFEENSRDPVERAMNYIRARTCIDFAKNSTANHSLRIYKGDLCAYYNGKPQAGSKDLSLGQGCATVRLALHEIIHALGGIHTQRRTDRDGYVRVDLPSARKDKWPQFKKIGADTFIKYVPYDYGSIMHYSATLFRAPNASNESHVITPHKERYLWTIGSGIPSFYDIMSINMHYNCSDNCKFSKKITCANGGVPNPRKCTECLCPYGYGGRFCDKRPAGCGEILKAKYKWKSKTIKFGSPRTKLNDLQDYAMCNYWIKAPPGKFIQIRVTELSAYCNYGCTWDAIEPKILKDKRTTSPRICCKNQLNETLTSKLNPTPIFSYASESPHFTFQYRYTDA